MSLKQFNKLAISDINEFVYGVAPYPVARPNGFTLGKGLIYPELNFTLPPMKVEKDTMPKVLDQYREIIDSALKRAVELESPGVVAEIELLPQATHTPQWGIDIAKLVKDIMVDYEAKHGLKSALRLTPVDIREDKNSPHMWHGEFWDKVMESFEGSAKAGADYLAIESVGGKEVHDDAILYCEINKSLFALGVLGVRDMHKLWTSITDIADRNGVVSAGDTACGFANTAMVLADKKYVPKVMSAVIRVIAAVRSLAAYEAGAVGPHKDCGYEGVFVKAITGTPISMEGKSSACAHLSSLGNVAACVADLWSNESVQNIKLLSGMAPTASMEQLIYDCRLMNVAASQGRDKALMLRDWLSLSDEYYDPQAYVLKPEVVLDISKVIVSEKTPYLRAKRAALYTLDILQKAYEAGNLKVDEREVVFFDTLRAQLDSASDDEEEFIAEMLKSVDLTKFDPKKYDL